ncbi:MAG: hypothetical protein NZL83_01955 [Candidatus Absconditabacterales bacterium]|nr:hypothetical protein [Candidatus Absconditabacterales bacterium]
MIRFVCHCAFGTVGMLARECKRLSLTVVSYNHFFVVCEGTSDDLLRALLWLRIATRICVVVASCVALSWDELYDNLKAIERSLWILPRTKPVIRAKANGCLLSSIPTIQSISQKAVMTKLFGNQQCLYEETSTIVVTGIHNKWTISIDVIGSMTDRCIRPRHGIAPLRENLACAALLQSGWRFRESLIDPFAGSGTIIIEAYLLARNLPPRIVRKQPSLSFPWFTPTHQRHDLIDHAYKNSYPGPFRLIAADHDVSMVRLMNDIFSHPIFSDMVEIRHANAFTSLDPTIRRCVTNPPYGKRIDRSRSFASLISWFDRAQLRGALVYGGDDDGYASTSQGHNNTSQQDHRSSIHRRPSQSRYPGRIAHHRYNGSDRCRLWCKI